MVRDRYNFVSYLALFFALLVLQQPEKSKFLKNEKDTGIYHYFT